MTQRELEEYRALRSTIRERGTARAWLQLAVFVGWASLSIATAALTDLPISTVLPLLVMAVGFETTFALHTGVERIGRYLEVFFEDDGACIRGWEHRVMAFSGSSRVSASDPLLIWYFWMATLVNFLPAILAGPILIEWSAIGALHLGFALRLAGARRQAARQRAADRERFLQIRADEVSTGGPGP